LPSHQIVERGVTLVPEGRGGFGDLTARENLLLGAYTPRARADQEANLARVLSLFPKLAERQNQVVATMSGGEQQMVAVGRAMMSSPSILMLDEPSLGLSPLLCRELFHSLAEVRGAGLGILLVEQNAKQSLAIAERGYLLENARITGEDTASRLTDDPAVQRAYLGGAAEPGRVAAPTSSRPASESVGRPRGRARTDDLIQGDIAGLVRQASERLAEHIAAERAKRPLPSAFCKTNRAAGDALREVLAEIELAAANARIGKPQDAPESFDDSPEIEIYRREKAGAGDRPGKLVRVRGGDDG
jgi:branched-chain amino acid transport system ATP-binding protein